MSKPRGGSEHVSPFFPLAGQRGSSLRVVFDGDVGAGDTGAGGAGSLMAE